MQFSPRAGTIAARCLESVVNEIFFIRLDGLLQRDVEDCSGGLRGLQRRREMVAMDDVFIADQHGALDRSWRVRAHFPASGSSLSMSMAGVEISFDAFAVSAVVNIQKMIGQQQHVRVCAPAAAAMKNGEHVQPVQKRSSRRRSPPESPFPDPCSWPQSTAARPLLRCAFRPPVRIRVPAGRAESLTAVAAFTSPDFIQKQSAALGQFEPPFFLRLCPRKGALFVPEQFRIQSACPCSAAQFTLMNSRPLFRSEL